MDWNDIQWLWLKIDPCVIYINEEIGIEIFYDNIYRNIYKWLVWFFFFLHELNMLWNFFSLAYPCFSCCVWTTMTVLRTRTNDHTGVGGSEGL